jgi:predicted phosphodiesterase
MKRVLLAVTVITLIGVAVVFSQNGKSLPGFSSDLQVEVADRNPWTHLRLNNNANDFQFVIVSDRTGGHREKVFSRAVEQINLMQPEFVLSVGDLIEGYTTNPEQAAKEWREFQSFTSKLKMPFFYVPGNHDLSNPFMEKLWTEKFGRRYYHFVYRDVLFLVLNSDDPAASSSVSAEQIEYVKNALEKNANVRWTIVALHKPIWAYGDLEKSGWLNVEKLLAGRKYTVFAGHVHRYQKYVRNGMNYYQLATTGGGSRLRGIRYGEFDHLVWVTMKDTGPVLANVMLDGIYPEDLVVPETNEPVVQLNRKAVHPVRGVVYVDGVPAANASIVFHMKEPGAKAPRRTCDGLIESDGSFALSTYAPSDGAPAGEYVVTIAHGDGFALKGPGPEIPEVYRKAATSPLTATIKSGPNDLTFELKSTATAPAPEKK